MSTIPILEYPHNTLKGVSLPVPEDRVTPKLQAFIDLLHETMYEAHGQGLAAPQVGRNIRVIVALLDVGGTGNRRPYTMINPVITASEGVYNGQEGCLSLPDIYTNVRRAGKITVEALNRDGNPYSLTLEGHAAAVVQHEIDHLDGKTLIRHLPKAKRKQYLRSRKQR
jgi:peptide deformylase